MSKQESMETLNRMLKSHDRFYEYSDDMRAYSKGQDERKAILNFMVNDLCMTLSEATDYYCKFINGN